MKTLPPFLLAAALLPLLAGCEKHRLDAQVKELCAKDGGVKVYETVKLPADRFDQWGMVKLYSERQEIKEAYRNDQSDTHMEHVMGSNYILKKNIHYYQKGSPSLHRYHAQVFSRADGKLLGESIGYSRGGGDFPGPWQPSSFSCPDRYGEVPLLMEVFVKSNLGE
ncbi:MAG: hypothetical protein R3E40_03570 [Rhodocyclaceae bacterium]|nr:hypothetical protein [Rhodocyclaceae bacterium]MCP5297667.1 hypothetical protein [Zoogloeaceae bacterium]